MSVIALDVGGTHIKGSVVDGGDVVEADEWYTRAEHGPSAVIDTVLRCADELVARAVRRGAKPQAAGIVVPGLVDEASGTAVLAANLGWRDTPVRRWVAEHLDLPVAFGHDVRAGGLAESRLGAGRGCADFAFVPVGTGVAAALVLGGRPFTGDRGFAGELGHLVVRPGGEPCVCGNRGCVETLASASAIARRYARAAGETGLSTKDVRTRAEAGDRLADRIWSEAVEALADGLAALTVLVDLDRLVIGGGLAKAGEAFLHPLRTAVAERLAFRPAPTLVPAELGHRAGCLGAALLAQDLLDGGGR
ncbi:ROK family protein [Kitasatospora sp. CM 4170]|uniref:ROK family protein n=1 Tax=Kitasatospora aburaviensis TaxID=67265 RepID=A0ABW1EVQ1_9ACTN|nr:ROK family protein [Kitasatospora sp. CM 4170]WNM49606.1 ROK family protein [Kitasatospora sp. CM 4170]